MNRKDKYDIKIADYLDGEMDAAAEDAFMQELSNNDALRQRYEEELQIRFLLQEEKADLPVAVGRIELFVARSKGIYWKVAAAVIIMVIAGTVVFFAIQKKQWQKEEISSHTVPVAKDTVPTFTSIEKPPVAVFGDSLFNRYYQAYRSDTGPVEVSLYYRQYRAKQYASVLEAVPVDYLLQGASDRQQLVDNYMNLYKGLSYIETGNPAKAKSFLEAVLNDKTAYQPAVEMPAKWYLSLVNLQMGEVQRCKENLRFLAKKTSPYERSANHLLNVLNSK